MSARNASVHFWSSRPELCSLTIWKVVERREMGPQGLISGYVAFEEPVPLASNGKLFGVIWSSE